MSNRSAFNEKFAVIGLGYVGLPVAAGLAEKFPDVVGFDINKTRVEELRNGHDATRELTSDALAAIDLRFSCDFADLEDRTFFIVTVPTPVDANRQPDLTAVRRATETVGRALKPGACVVYESTVYPGVTDEICRPLLAKVSGLVPGVDFTVGYSPERINPGDKEHTLKRIVKVVSGEDEATLERVAQVYEAIVDAGVHRAQSIMVAEAAKVIENTQRDVNIALMNELAKIFDLMNIRTADVLAAAGTKWNFLRFSPGLVGGHCIGVDPYYLTARAESLGYHSEVILSGRRINDGMGRFVAQKFIKMMISAGKSIHSARVGVLGLTFKENVPDLRNSRVPDIIEELRSFGIDPLIHDPMVTDEAAHEEYGLALTPWDEMKDLDGIILAVNHNHYRELTHADFDARMRGRTVLVDVKSAIPPFPASSDALYWSL